VVYRSECHLVALIEFILVETLGGEKGVKQCQRKRALSMKMAAGSIAVQIRV
jgi:hypothetical protein